MRWWRVVVVVGMVMGANVQAQDVPLNEAQRAQVRQSLEGLALGLDRMVLLHKDCAQRDTKEVCAIEAKQLANMRAQQHLLCRRHAIPSGQYGCP